MGTKGSKNTTGLNTNSTAPELYSDQTMYTVFEKDIKQQKVFDYFDNCEDACKHYHTDLRRFKCVMMTVVIKNNNTDQIYVPLRNHTHG